MIRLKKVAQDDRNCTPHLLVGTGGSQPYAYKLQQCHQYDSDNDYTYLQWTDIEIVDEDAAEYEEEER